MSCQTAVPPPLEIPGSSVCVAVRIIDTGARLSGPTPTVVQPSYPGHEYLTNMPALPFLIEHASGKKVVFDLGIRKDWQNFSPTTMKAWHSAGVQCKGAKAVVDDLEEGGVKKEEIDSVSWRY